MSIIIRSGTYVKYRNRLYKKSTKDTAKGMVKILSGDKSDLKNGFICDYSQEFIEKYWFAGCDDFKIFMNSKTEETENDNGVL
ncbi:MAG: hypothetical protein KH324_09350 [Ruminococcus sp.]|nr:hypothetical protein [Ruminococcus sp.]